MLKKKPKIKILSRSEIHGRAKIYHRIKSFWEKIKDFFKKDDYTKIIKKFKAHGFECLIAVINGSWYTAYVGVPRDHPFYGKDDEYINRFVSAHGGITFAGESVLGYRKEGIWWIGIDFAHALDICIGKYIRKTYLIIDLNHYNVWNVKRVEKEIRNLAKQLKVKNLVLEHL